MSPVSLTLTMSGIAGHRTGQTSSSTDDLAIVEQFLSSNDADKFEILVRRYQGKVFKLAASILGGSAMNDAEDATQEVFIVVYRNLQSFRGESAFSTWLYRVARNQIIAYGRRMAHRALFVDADVLQTQADDAAHTDPLSVTTADQTRVRLKGMVDQLAELQRTIVYLYYWHGETIAEIAVLMELKDGTVKSILYRARQKLGQVLQEKGCDN